MLDARTAFSETEGPRRSRIPFAFRSPAHAAMVERDADDSLILALDHADPAERTRAVGYIVGHPQRLSL